MNRPQLNLKTTWQRVVGSNVIMGGIIGLVTGSLGWLLSLLLQRGVVSPLLCQSTDSFGACANGGTIAWWFALILLSVAGLFVMVNRGIYRPLLVVLAVFASVWGIWAWLGYMPWWQAALWQGGIFAFAYGLYTLLARASNFGISLGLMVAAIIIVRVITMLS